MNDVLGSTPQSGALAFLQDRLDYERSPAIAYGERTYKLDRMAEILARLGNPERRLRIVHIAGTKGKGSTAALIGGVLTAAGYRVGIFSSPHLFRVEERMAIDGSPCSASELENLVAQIRPVVRAMEAAPNEEAGAARSALGSEMGDGGGIPLAASLEGRPTYFEITTALALLHFAQRQVDLAILEVGMGGRLDSTNVCQPSVSVITSISYDHTRELGPTLALIAGEKAGIVKPGVPVVSGVTSAEPRDVIRDKCSAEGSPLWELGRDFHVAYRPPQHMEHAASPATIDFRGAAGAAFSGIDLRLFGRHQAANAAVALATLDRLREQGLQIDESAVREGLATIACPARLQILTRHPTVVIDAAHNVASAQALVDTLIESFDARRRFLVFATTRDKDLQGMLRVLLPNFDRIWFTRYASNPRGVPPEELLAAARQCGPVGRELLASNRIETAATPDLALRALREQVQRDDLACFTGSFFLAVDVHDELLRNPLGAG